MLVGLRETKMVKLSRGEQVAGRHGQRRMSGEGSVSLNRNVVSINPQANGWMVVGEQRTETVSSRPSSPSESLSWSKTMRWIFAGKPAVGSPYRDIGGSHNDIRAEAEEGGDVVLVDLTIGARRRDLDVGHFLFQGETRPWRQIALTRRPVG